MGDCVAGHFLPDALHIQSMEHSVFIYDLAPGHIHADIAAPGGVDQIFLHIVAGEEVEILKVEQDEVGDLARLNDAGVAAQSLGVDSIAGATVSTAGFMAAMSDAIAQAGGNVDEWKARPVEKRAPETVELTTDIVIIGAGSAGLSAAVEAVDLGAKVIVVEKQEVLGSATTRSEGFIQAAGTQYQRDHGVEGDT